MILLLCTMFLLFVSLKSVQSKINYFSCCCFDVEIFVPKRPFMSTLYIKLCMLQVLHSGYNVLGGLKSLATPSDVNPPCTLYPSLCPSSINNYYCIRVVFLTFPRTIIKYYCAVICQIVFCLVFAHTIKPYMRL